MDTIELTIRIPALEHDRIIGWLEGWATGFVQEDATLRAYIPPDRWSPTRRKQLQKRLAADGYPNAVTVQRLSDRNWNEAWEQSITPVRAGPFLLCPTSAAVPPDEADATVLRVDPAMSFGTGHHATTRLALRLLANRLSPGDRVLDVGTGTGVLAIAACRHGATTAVGVDTDSNAVRNARQNAAQNEVADCVTVRHGSVAAAPEGSFDVVVANVTRDTLLDLLPALHDRLTTDGSLILSGLLTGQRSHMEGALRDRALTIVEEIDEEGWWACAATSGPANFPPD